MNSASMNKIRHDGSGQYQVRILRKGTSVVYVHEGRVLTMDSPRKGTVVQLPRGEMMKVADVGAVNANPADVKPRQQDAVFLRRYKQ